MPKALFNIAFTLPLPPSKLRGNARANYQAQRNFYNLTADYNYFAYTLDGKKVVKNANAEHYFTREGTNTGLFNLHGTIDKEQIKGLKTQLKKTKSIIWHGFISFDEETSRGFNTQENAVKFMKQTFGGFLSRAGFKKDNIELYASLHNDTDHRHIHFAFFEKEPKRRDKNGVLGYRRMGKIESKAIDNYLVSANMHLSEHKDEYYTARDEAMSRLNEVRKQRKELTAIRNQNLYFALNNLLSKLPKKGRLGYFSENMRHLRAEIDSVTELLIATNSEAISAHLNALKQLARVKAETTQLIQDNRLIYVDDRRMNKEQIDAVMNGDKTATKSVDEKNIDYFERLETDYKGRLGNITIGICLDLRKSGFDERRRAWVNSKMLKIKAKNRRKRREKILAGAIGNIRSTADIYIRTNFLKTLQQNEYDIEQQRKYGRVS